MGQAEAQCRRLWLGLNQSEGAGILAAISCKLTSAASTNMPEQVMGVNKRMKVEPVEEMCGAVGRRRARESLRGLRNQRHLNAVLVSPESRANSACKFVINRGTLQLSISKNCIYESDVVHNGQQQNVTADPRFLFRNVLETLNPLSVPVSSLTYQTRSRCGIKPCQRHNSPKGCVLSGGLN